MPPHLGLSQVRPGNTETYHNVEDEYSPLPVLCLRPCFTPFTLKSLKYSFLHILHFSTFELPWSSNSAVFKKQKISNQKHSNPHWATIGHTPPTGKPLLLCRPSQFWLTTALRMPSSTSCTNIMCVGVGTACVVLLVLMAALLCLPCARSSHTPGPRERGKRGGKSGSCVHDDDVLTCLHLGVHATPEIRNWRGRTIPNIENSRYEHH